MTHNMSRFYSGVYDSTKQLASYREQEENSDYLITEYLRRIRMDIIYRCNIMMTDAQLFDGLFFHLSLERSLCNELRWGLLGKGVIEIRVRGSSADETLNKMLSKPFAFSSLRDHTLQSRVFAEMAEVLGGAGINCGGWEEIMGKVKERIDVDDRNAIDQLIENIRSLSEMAKGATREWGPPERFIGKWKDGADKVSKVVNGLKRYAFPKNSPLPEFLGEVTEQLGKEFPERSKIDNRYRDLKRNPSLDSTESKALDTAIEEFYKIYNAAIAYQHGAHDLDIGESEPEDLSRMEDRKCAVMEESHQERRLSDLGELTWKDFWELLEAKDSPWKEWKKYRSNPGAWEKRDVERAQDKLFKYLEKQISGRSRETASMLGGGSDIFKHRISGFLSMLPFRGGCFFSGMGFGASAETGGLNPTIVV